MKTLLTLTLLALTTSICSAQNFEGKIVYDISYESKNPQLPNEQLVAMMGSKQEYYIKDGDYKSVMNGALVQWQLYRNQDNKLYTKMSNSEAALWNDGAVNADSLIDIKVNRNVVEILGYPCDELVLNCKSGTQKFYFNSKLAVDTELYENHKYGNWFNYIEQSKSLPLKMVVDNAQFVMVSTANSVEAGELTVTDFELPENMPTTKSPY
jgi:hypothetical protein